MPPEWPADLSLPARYTPERVLGRGAFGVVVLATDTTLDRPVALKFLEVRGPSETERFRREARFAARLDHPSIVRVYELAEHGGRPYIAMQYVDGLPLGEAPLGRQGILAAARDAAEALGHAHATGLVHRDVKPENVLVDAAGSAYVTDFGIARDVSRDAGATLSSEGSIVGTPALMAPEQARGELGAIDARTDVYGLGATLYAVLTGRFPYAGANVVEVLQQLLRGDPPPPPRSWDPSIDPSLERVVVRCMQLRPADRYPRMADVAADLDRVRRGDTVAPQGGSWFFAKVRERVPEPPRRRTEDDVALVLDVAHELAAWDQRLYRISSNLPAAWPRLDELRARLDDVLAARPDFALGRLHRGLVAFRRGDLDAALDDVEAAIDRVGELPSAHFELGRLHLAVYLRERRAAQRHVDPAGTEVHLKEIHERFVRAALAFQQAQAGRRALDTWQVHFATAVERLAEHDAAGCIAQCDAILTEDADLDDVWRLRGDAQREAGEDPCTSYERAVDVRRSDHESLRAMADWLANEGRVEEADAAIERILAIVPGDADALALRARLLRDRGAPGALAAAEAAAVADPQSYDAAVGLATTLLDEADEPSLTRALSEVQRARALPGCPNRLDILEVQLRMARMGVAGDAHGDRQGLTRFLDYDRTNDGGPWPELVQRIRAAADS